MSGKLKCEYLKKYRESIAEKYDIQGFKYEKCNNNGKCIGTCPKCEEEVKKLNEKLNEYCNIENKYKSINLPETIEQVNCHTPVNLSAYKKGLLEDGTSTASIFGIERLCINTDGPGITTLVGLYGCPLSCIFCINKQEGNSKIISVDELYDIVLQDDLYYNHSDGGICFGGNEPLEQKEFILSFIKKMRKENKNWKIGIETSLSVSMRNSIKELLSLIDYIIVDIKSMDKDIYKFYTNSSMNTKVYENLKYLVQNVSKDKLTIKVPKIPYFTSDEDVSNSVKDLLEMGFLYNNIKVIDYIIPKGCDINEERIGGDIDPASLNDIDGFSGVDKKLLENCRLEGDISIDVNNKENEEEDITDLDIDIKELQSDYEKNEKNKENYFNDYFKISEGAIKEIKYNKNQ